MRDLPYIREPRCKKCGKEIRRQEQEYCHDCANHIHTYQEGLALFSYDSRMKKSIEAFKYKNRREYGEFYGEELWRRLGGKIERWNADVLVPVPIHSLRRRERGFNQAEVLAREISRHGNIPVDASLLVRRKKTSPQRELNDKERIKNVEDAFQLAKNVVQYRKIIIVDDIYTTGSTVDACASCLLRGGARQVYFLCICTGKGY